MEITGTSSLARRAQSYWGVLGQRNPSSPEQGAEMGAPVLHAPRFPPASYAVCLQLEGIPAERCSWPLSLRKLDFCTDAVSLVLQGRIEQQVDLLLAWGKTRSSENHNGCVVVGETVVITWKEKCKKMMMTMSSWLSTCPTWRALLFSFGEGFWLIALLWC